MTTPYIPPDQVDAYDYIVVGGGTAGCVVAARLAERLPHRRVLLIEAGPSDFMDRRVLDLRRWLSLLGGELDFDYGTTPQPMGNSHIRHSRAKVLGGCSSHNTLISFRPLAHDLRVWRSMGAAGWTTEAVAAAVDRLRNTVRVVDARHRNALCKDWVAAGSAALGIPVVDDFNDGIARDGHLGAGVGFLSVSYDADTGERSSASVAYLHPMLRGEERRPNLTVVTEAWVSRVNVGGGGGVGGGGESNTSKSNKTNNNNKSNNGNGDAASVDGVDVALKDGSRRRLRARVETVLCAGAIDTPRLLLLSGIGPDDQLRPLGIDVVHDLAGVGQNLADHPETVMLFELRRPVPADQTTMDSDAALFLRREPPDADRGRPSPANPTGLADGAVADVMMHCYQVPFVLHTARLGYDVPADGYAFCMTPNVPRPRSRGVLSLASADPAVPPRLDFAYFTDPDGYDAATLVYGLRAARRIARQPPFCHWIAREVAPGPDVQSDDQLSRYARSVAHTVYHPVGTTRTGAPDDPRAVVDPRLRLRGLRRLRIADAGVFPTIPTVNPMLTVLAVAERCVDMMVEDEHRAARL